jgi:transposase-like protein
MLLYVFSLSTSYSFASHFIPISRLIFILRYYGTMPPAKKVLTPGSYAIGAKKKPKVTLKKGRPVVVGTKKRKKREKAKRRDKYTQEDMAEAVRLVKEEDYSISAASVATNSVKKNAVPRMTLSDRLRMDKPNPSLGRPQELSPEVEEALVQCLEMCSEFQFPMRKRDLQDLVQAYCVENEVRTRWKNDRPGSDWIRSSVEPPCEGEKTF